MAGLAAGRMNAGSPDEALIAAARDGDRDAFSDLMARYRGVAFAYAYARLRDRDEAEDVAQETFVRAYLALGRLRGPRSWEAWLMRILRNLCADALRRRKVRRSEPMDPDWTDGGPSPEMLAVTAERSRELNAAVAALPEKYRIPLVMRYGSGCSYREIAAAMGVPESTVIGRLAGALRLMRRSLGAEDKR
jgi:RNA polymerase sigma-70 factor (ECF subfamily)